MTDLITEDMMVPSEPGIDIFVRNKRPANLAKYTPERTLLFVHGSTYPAHTGFDIPLGGQSWMESIASRGYDVYCLDVRGYGRSTRPEGDGRAAAEQSAGGAHAGRGEGHHRGAELHPQAPQHRQAQSARLVVGLHPDGDHRDPEPRQGRAADALRAGLAAHHAVAARAGPGPLGAYRTVTREQAKARWLNGVPEDKQAALIPPGWFEQWADATWATDPVGAKQNPPVVRAPNGTVRTPRSSGPPARRCTTRRKITVPTLIAIGEWDKDTPPYMAQTMFPLLVNSPGKRLVMLAEGTHHMMLEKNREALFRAVQAFLDEGCE